MSTKVLNAFETIYDRIITGFTPNEMLLLELVCELCAT